MPSPRPRPPSRQRRFAVRALMVVVAAVAASPVSGEQGGGLAAPANAARVAQSATKDFIGSAVSAVGGLLGGEPAAGGPAPAAGQEVLPTPASAPTRGFTIPMATPDDTGAIEISSDGGLVSLIVRDAPLRHVMSLLADAHELSLVFASATDVPVTAKLDRVPIERAIDAVLLANGFTWTRSGRVIYVTNAAEESTLPAAVQGRRVAVLELDFASAADVDQGVKGLLSPVGKSWVLESSDADNRRTKEAVVVEDLEANLQRIERFVCEADQPPRQVLIEAHLLEIELDRDKRAGVNLSAIARLSGARLTAGAVGLANSGASPAFLIENTGGDLGLLIESLITTTDAKTLAKPRLLAVNGQQARIQIGQQLGFRVTTTTQTSTLESVEFLNVGVVLTVTPRITRDGRVLMRIKPEVSSGVVNPNTGLPEEETTEVETDVLLIDGQGMVIGGLIQERDDVLVSRVPLLSQLPRAGFLFERRQEVKRRTELIVALKPHILPYSPVEQGRNDTEFARSDDPLLHGPLCRHPRPYEPRLPGALYPTNKPACLQEAEHLPSAAWAPPATTLAAQRPPTTTADPLRPRRLPPIEQADATARRPATHHPAPRLVY